MPFRTYFIPLRAPRDVEDELNSFLRSHRVVHLERRWLERPDELGWSFFIEYQEPAPSSSKVKQQSGERVDWRDKLAPADFALFCRLKDWRRGVAEAETVPAFMVFSNQQLATIAERRITSREDLAKVPGVGEAKLQRYSEPLFTVIREFGSASDETNQPTL